MLAIRRRGKVHESKRDVVRRSTALHALCGVAMLPSFALGASVKKQNPDLLASRRSVNYGVAFASFGPLDTNLFIAAADASTPRALLATPGHDYNASFSADSAWIVFTSERYGAADLFRVRSDASDMQRLTDGPSFDDQGTMSPDGASIAFVSSRSGHANLWILNLQTRALGNVTQHEAGDFRPAWSPDGRWLAFSSDRDSKNPKSAFVTLHSTELFIIRPDGTGLKKLTDGNAFAGSPVWSPDGNRLAFYSCAISDVANFTSVRRRRSTTQIKTIDVGSGELQTHTDGPGEKLQPRWLGPDRIAYISGGPDGGVEVLSGTPRGRGEFCSPAWAPNGNSVVFHRERQNGWPPLATWRSLDANFALLRSGIFPSFHPSGKTFVLNDRTAGALHNSIIRMSADGSQRSVLFTDPNRSALAPAFSPSGEYIAFGLGGFFQMNTGDTIADVAVMRSDGTDLRILTDGSGNLGFPSWAPDGGQIVFRSSGHGQNGLRIVDVMSRTVRTVTEGAASDNLPAWSPKGDRIAFTRIGDGDSDVYSIDPDGTHLKQLTTSPGNDGHSAWSPDGEWIAFTSARGGFKDEAVLHAYNSQPYGDLYVMRADGSDVRRLTDNQYEEGTPTFIPSR